MNSTTGKVLDDARHVRTSVIIAYKVQSVPELWSAVVLAELMSGAADDSIRKAHEATRQAAVQEEKLIVPTSEDWLLASRILALPEPQEESWRPGVNDHPIFPLFDHLKFPPVV